MLTQLRHGPVELHELDRREPELLTIQRGYYHLRQLVGHAIAITQSIIFNNEDQLLISN